MCGSLAGWSFRVPLLGGKGGAVSRARTAPSCALAEMMADSGFVKIC